MSSGIRIGRLRASVKRLEAMAGKGGRCADCHLNRRHPRPRPGDQTPRPGDSLTVACEFCDTKTVVSLAGLSEEGRELQRLHYAPLAARYTDARVSAYWCWFILDPKVARSAQSLKHSEERLKYGTARPGRDPAGRKLAELRAEARGLIQDKRKRLAAKYGENPFPEQGRLMDSLLERLPTRRAAGPHDERLLNLLRREAVLEARAVLETIMLGRPLTATAAALAGLRSAKPGIVEKARLESEGPEPSTLRGGGVVRSAAGQHAAAVEIARLIREQLMMGPEKYEAREAERWRGEAERKRLERQAGSAPPANPPPEVGDPEALPPDDGRPNYLKRAVHWHKTGEWVPVEQWEME